jgi:hypothetical protein
MASRSRAAFEAGMGQAWRLSNALSVGGRSAIRPPACPSCGYPIAARDDNPRAKPAPRLPDPPPRSPSPPPTTSPLSASAISIDNVIPPQQRTKLNPLAKPRFNNFIARHWRGELPLWVSYWIIAFLANIAAVLFVIFVTGALSAESGYNPIRIFSILSAIWSGVVAIAIWQLVGVWRSANRYIAQKVTQKKRSVGYVGKVGSHHWYFAGRRLFHSIWVSANRSRCQNGIFERSDHSQLRTADNAKWYRSGNFWRLQIWIERRLFFAYSMLHLVLR